MRIKPSVRTKDGWSLRQVLRELVPQVDDAGLADCVSFFQKRIKAQQKAKTRRTARPTLSVKRVAGELCAVLHEDGKMDYIQPFPVDVRFIRAAIEVWWLGRE